MAEDVCPVWAGRLMVSPLRKLFQNPVKIVGPYIQEGMTVLEPGCAMGFYSLPAARLVGGEGRVISIDLQRPMLDVLKKRAQKAGLLERLHLRECTVASLQIEDLEGTIDFAFVLAVVHEVPDQAVFFSEIYAALKPQTKCLVAEPKGHVIWEEFEQSLILAKAQGFKVLQQFQRFGARVAVLEKP